MTASEQTDAPVGVKLRTDIEYRTGNPSPYRARVRWTDPATNTHLSRSTMFPTEEEAKNWLNRVVKAAELGVDVDRAVIALGEYGDSVMDLAMRGLELKPRTGSVGTCGSSPPSATSRSSASRPASPTAPSTPGSPTAPESPPSSAPSPCWSG
ncbi:hypothetical protein [Kitasatospora sp. NPDC088783]|uniref:hypothetical protein n=1 Tax=Kitasatospora sp. NPDC088783 TaxID=3364077 RepID=UPI0037F67A15